MCDALFCHSGYGNFVCHSITYLADVDYQLPIVLLVLAFVVLERLPHDLVTPTPAATDAHVWVDGGDMERTSGWARRDPTASCSSIFWRLRTSCSALIAARSFRTVLITSFLSAIVLLCSAMVSFSAISATISSRTESHSVHSRGAYVLPRGNANCSRCCAWVAIGSVVCGVGWGVVIRSGCVYCVPVVPALSDF